MSRKKTLVALAATALAAAILASPAEARSKGKNFYFLKNGAMYSFRAYKLYKEPEVYKQLRKVFHLGPQWGPTMYIPQSGPDATGGGGNSGGGSKSGTPPTPPDRPLA